MIQTIDFQILDWIQQYCRCGFLDFLMPKITVLGSKGILWIVIGVILLIWKQHRRGGIAVLTGLLGALLVGNVFLKHLVKRSRPCWINTDINMLIGIPRDYSFPSGHTLASFVAATVLMKYDRRLGIPALVIACLVAFSRLYLYVHFPSDVLAGALIGIVIGLIVSRIFFRRDRHEDDVKLLE